MFDEHFDGWARTDFDAYASRKWRSNRFNLARGRVRLRLIDLLQRAAAAADVDVSGFELWSALDHPSFFNGHTVRDQRVAWCRPKADRERLARADHAVEAERVDRCHTHLGVEVSEAGLRLLFSVPAEARFDRSLLPSSEATLASAAAAVGLVAGGDAADGAGGAARADWTLAQLVPAAEALTDEEAAVAQVADWLGHLWPHLQALTWVESHDPGELLPLVAKADALHAAGPQRPAPAQESPRSEVAAASSAPAAAPRPIGAGQHRKRPKLAPAGSGAAARKEEEARLQAERDAKRARALAILAAEAQTAKAAAGGARHGGGARRDGSARGQGPRGADQPQGRGPRRDGPHRGGPRRDGPRRDGPRRDGPRRDGPRRDAPGRGRPGGGGRPYEVRPERSKVTGLAVGAEVELVGGLFAGKRGTVQAVKRGEAEVQVGAMRLNVPVAGLRPV